MTSSTVSSIAKVLVRGSPPESMHQEFPHLTGSIISPASDLSALHRDPPHILIGTPNAIMDVIHRVPGCLHLRALSTVVVDEIDSLLRWAPSHVRGPRKKKVLRKIEKHPMTLLQIMDALFASETANRPWSHRKAFLSDQHAPAQRPQLVFLSATLRNRLRTALYGAFGWLKRDHVAQLIWAPSKSHPAHALNRTVDHHVLVVSEDGSIKNLPGARSCKEVEHHQSIEANTTTESGDEFLYEEEDAMLDEADADSMDLPLTVNPVMLEAVASIFALDVPRVALLILPASASVRRVIFELRQLGVDAHALDLLGNEAGGAHLLSRDASVPSENPTLLVSTQATTRGIDFPALSHVFLLGVPRERAGDAYLHFGGRVGRFGKRGKVVTILEAKRLMDEKLAVGDEPKKMSILLKQMGITPTKLEHFD
ncbi:hypothetical protein ID866_9150 [Astraeus odoratus]|nr:hypothetical protein ID866_9150 [Astraeus odoratus]